jgi:PRC-barrel domain
VRSSPQHWKPSVSGPRALCAAATLAIAVGLNCTASAQPAGVSSTPPTSSRGGQPLRPGISDEQKPVTELIGASVLSKDHHLVGVIDAVVGDSSGGPKTVIVGLAGFLGLGEKDVAIPDSGIEAAPRVTRTAAQELGDGKYAGSTPYRVIVPMTLQELAAAPAYTGKETGIPSANSGTPEDVKKEPRSSTKSGGSG